MLKSLKIKESHEGSLLKKQNVIGTAIGEKWKNGATTGKEAVLVFVEEKMAKEKVAKKFSSSDLVPSDIEGIPTDVIEVGVIKKHNTSKVRPIRPGFSISHRKITAGTLGGFFIDKDGDPVLLSNNHVIANENSARAGDIIYQPGTMDARGSLMFKGWSEPIEKLPYIAMLKKFVRIKRNGNNQDSAIAKLHPSIVRLVNDTYPTINQKLSGFGIARIGTQVQKEGRTTGHTTGRVIGTNATFTVGYDFGPAQFRNCVVTTAISKGGDSGSIIFDMNMKAVGLLFAGSPTVTIANPMNVVQSHYGLRPWSPDSIRVPDPIAMFGLSWEKMKSASSKLEKVDDIITMESGANQYCYYESALQKPIKSVSCTINTGSDVGATWGPGLVVGWPNGMLKVNLRKETFGGYYNSNYNISVGETKPNTNYPVRIRRSRTTWVGEVMDSNKWYTVIEVPLSTFPNNPIVVRVGKTALLGGNIDHNPIGDVGRCTISDFKIS